MRKKVFDSEIEKKIITGVITNKEFARVFFSELNKPELMKIPFSKFVLKWCEDYWDKFEDVPKETIKAIFESEQHSLDESISEGVQMFLRNLSNDFEGKFNAKYYLQKAEEYLQVQKLEKLRSDIGAAISSSKLKEIEEEIACWNQVKRLESKGISNLDVDKIQQILCDESQEIFTPSGKLGELLGTMYAGDFWAVAGPEKSGKSMWIMALEIMALQQGCNVAHFDFEMGERKYWARFGSAVSGLPLKEKHKNVRIPILDAGNMLKYIWEERPVFNPRKNTKSIKKLTEIAGGQLRVVCLPSNTTSIKDVETHLSIWEQEGFVPDLIGMDYADLMVSKEKEYRHKLDDIWKGIKSLGQARNCGTISGTQTDKKTYGKEVGKGNIAEDKRKASHVDLMFALNVTDGDRKNGVYKIKKLFTRDDSEERWKELIAVGNLSIGRPFMDGYIEEIEQEEK